MNRLIFILFIFTIVGCSENNLRQITELELINRIVNQNMPDPSKVKIVTKDGAEISIDSLKSLEESGKYFEDFYVNDKNEIVQILVRKKTKDDQKLIFKINQKLNEGPEIQLIEVNCDDKVNILQKVFERDQGMRRGGNNINPEIDHENLEIIVSFLNKCGMPTLKDVNDEQMAGIWTILQHAPAKYQSKYIPLLEESAKKGDLKWSVIALMKDRALMYEGKPQIYGSQVSNGELYELFEPEYVNQRRAEIDMEPIEEYLKRFGIEFNIKQRTK